MPPVPTRLGGIGLEIRDSAGATHPALLVFVWSTQINFQVPAVTGDRRGDTGPDRRSWAEHGRRDARDAVAPGLFMVNRGNATPAALGVRVAPDGGQTAVPVFNCFGPVVTTFSCGPAAIQLTGDPVYLSFLEPVSGEPTRATVTASLAECGSSRVCRTTGNTRGRCRSTSVCRYPTDSPRT